MEPLRSRGHASFTNSHHQLGGSCLPQYDTQTFTHWPLLAKKVNCLLDRNLCLCQGPLGILPSYAAADRRHFFHLFLSFPACFYSHLSALPSESTLINHHAVNLRLSPFKALNSHILPRRQPKGRGNRREPPREPTPRCYGNIQSWQGQTSQLGHTAISRSDKAKGSKRQPPTCPGKASFAGD